MQNTHTIEANLLDWQAKEIYPAKVHVDDGKIYSIEKIDKQVKGYIMPGFVDAHVHIESSLLIPSEFARMAVMHGTIATVSDPHEIANVCGKDGIRFMIANGKKVPFYFCFGAPSCVPATSFETAGAAIDANDISDLLDSPDIYYLAEMMNYPGVIYHDNEVMKKIEHASRKQMPIDGHAPGLRGDILDQYLSAGISTDHECFTLEEAREKAQKGMKILIREGSAARNFDALIPIIAEFPQLVMFCSDDKHPDSLKVGHINQLAAKALALGYNFWDVIYAACIHPVIHYKIPCGLLRVGDSADFIISEDLDFKHIKTFIKGSMVSNDGESLVARIEEVAINNFNISYKQTSDFKLSIPSNSAKAKVIDILDGQLITEQSIIELDAGTHEFVTDLQNDILKLVVVNRYNDAPVAIALVKNASMHIGAIASSVAHDSHNIVAIGCTDEDICKAVNLIIANKGGLAYADASIEKILPLPVAGLMSHADAWEIADAYTEIDNLVKQKTGTTLKAPFMTLSFLALPVIPHLKLSDKGLFDVDTFAFTPLFSS